MVSFSKDESDETSVSGSLLTPQGSVGRAAGYAAGMLVAQVLYVLVGGFSFMIGVGIAHHDWVHTLPTIGFGPAVLIATFLRGALHMTTFGFGGVK